MGMGITPISSTTSEQTTNMNQDKPDKTSKDVNSITISNKTTNHQIDNQANTTSQINTTTDDNSNPLL
jgi:hypothetical protein